MRIEWLVFDIYVSIHRVYASSSETVWLTVKIDLSGCVIWIVKFWTQANVIYEHSCYWFFYISSHTFTPTFSFSNDHHLLDMKMIRFWGIYGIADIATSCQNWKIECTSRLGNLLNECWAGFSVGHELPIFEWKLNWLYSRGIPL